MVRIRPLISEETGTVVVQETYFVIRHDCGFLSAVLMVEFLDAGAGAEWICGDVRNGLLYGGGVIDSREKLKPAGSLTTKVGGCHVRA